MKGLKDDFSWMSSTQVLSKCSRFGELTTACWRWFWLRILYCSVWISFRDLGWVEIWRNNPVCAHAGSPIIVVDVVCLALAFVTFVHCPSMPPLLWSILRWSFEAFQNVVYLCRKNRWWWGGVDGAREVHLSSDPPRCRRCSIDNFIVLKWNLQWMIYSIQFSTLSQQSRAMPSMVWWKHSRRKDQSDCQALQRFMAIYL